MTGASQQADYGSRARVAIAVPQANPTVEPETRALLPFDIGVYATRLTHAAPRVEDRLHHYIHNLPAAIRSFGTLNIRAFGFGCTGSSYLAGSELEDDLTGAAQKEFGIPVVTAAQAIRQSLGLLKAQRIALVSPYPAALSDAGYRYWEQAGIEVVAKLRVDPDLHDTHRIYELTNNDALQALRAVAAEAARANVDCIVASGTGMPSLRALAAFRAENGLPVLSSNLCLGWALYRSVAPELAPATATQMRWAI